MPTKYLSVSVLLTICAGEVPAQTAVELHAEASVRWAGLDEAQRILTSEDRFLAALSRFDVQSRLKTDGDVSQEDLARFAAQQARRWEPAEIEKLTGVLARIAQRLGGFKLPFPREVLLIKTTGREEGGAAYCRRHAVILPQSYVDAQETRLERTLIHELFHILSSANPDWRYQLYELIGFKRCAGVQLPEMLRERKITNPDAPDLDVLINLNSGGTTQVVVPILYSSLPQYDPQRGGSFFQYLVFRLMLVQRVAGQWQPVIRNGQPVLLDPANQASYHRQIGRNARTIIHPEEILAENFTHLILGTAGLPSPALIERLRYRLRATE